MNRNENSDTVVEVFLRKADVRPEALSDVKKEHLKDALKDYSVEEVENFFKLGLSDTIGKLQFLVVDLTGVAKKVDLARTVEERQKMEERMQRIILKIKEILSQPWDKSVKSILDSSTSSFMESYSYSLNIPDDKTKELMKKIGLGARVVGLIASIGLTIAGVLISHVLLYCGVGLLIVGIVVFVALNRKKFSRKEKSKFSDSTFGESLKKTGIFDQSELNPIKSSR